MTMQIAQDITAVHAVTEVSRANALTATRRAAGYTALAGALTMFVGAILWGTTGTDLWLVLDTGDMASYLTAVGAYQGQLIANLSVWIAGVLILAVAGHMLGELSQTRRVLARIGGLCYAVAAPLVIVSYFTMLALVVQIAPDTSPTSLAIAEVLGWIGAHADDLATALILGFGPLFFSLAGRGEWASKWLVWWSFVCGVCAALSLFALYFPNTALSGLAFIIIPVGLIWLIWTGVILLRRG